MKKVAIACQGGGSHTAFTAGVLQRLFAPDLRDRYRLVGLSGTSGGAMCAALAWTGLQLGGHDDAIARLQAFWDELMIRDPGTRLLNLWGLEALRFPVKVEVNPYHYPEYARNELLRIARRHIPLCEAQGKRSNPQLRLLVAAADVLSGDYTIFGDCSLTHEHLLASAAVPPIYRAEKLGGCWYWDGLLSSNPPVREFTDTERMMTEKPDEIWIIQINPQRTDHEPVTFGGIVDRRNELAGNLALAQELYFIHKINELAAERKRDHPDVPWRYQHIETKFVEMPPEMVKKLDYASKLDRDATHVQDLMDAGRKAGHRFLDETATQDGSIPKANRCVP